MLFSREGVQRDLLPLIEGTTVSTKHGPIKTDHILFIASGAFQLAKPSDLLPELQGRLPIRVELSALNEDEFYNILKENLKIRHGVNPTHTLKEIYKLIELFPDSINLFGAFYKGEMIAGVLNFIIKDDVVLAFYISHKEEFQELRPLNLLFYSIFNWALKEKINVYDFGIFTVEGEPNMGLGRFKENFGASGIFRDTFQITL